MSTTNRTWKAYKIYPLQEAILIGFCLFIAIFSSTFFLYHYALSAQEGEIKEGLLRTAKVVSNFIDKDIHADLAEGQETTLKYKEAIIPLEKTLKADDSIEYLYTAILKDGKVYFILDGTPLGDADNDGVEDKALIMDEYKEASADIIRSLKNQEIVISDKPNTDRWGSFLSAYIPLYDTQGDFVAVLGIDIEATKYFSRLEPIKRATTRTMVIGFFISFLVASIVWFTRNFGLKINNKRKELFDEL
jgi:sensor histidine kinase regulating citrate/malate metabolism